MVATEMLPIFVLAGVSNVLGHGGMVWPPIWQDGHSTSLNKITGYKIYSDPKVKICSECSWLKNTFFN